jgi:cytochrome c553
MMSRWYGRLGWIGAISLAWANTVWAAPGDPIAGQAKAQVCVACHGAKGISSDTAIPHLAAQPPLSIFYQLMAFKNQTRMGGGMEQLAANLGDQDMRDLAAYFSAQPPPAPLGAQDAQRVTKGQQLAQQNYCSSCHGAQLQGQKHVARLAGQHSTYLISQLQQLRSGQRVDMDGTMGSAARGLSDDDIEAIAAYARTLN